MTINENNVSIRYEVILEYNGEPILDSKTAQLLKLINEKGSILAASRALGIPYSRAWEIIMKLERTLGVKLIKAFRGGKGGGGTRLTDTALKLLEIYDRAEKKLRRHMGIPYARKHIALQEPDIIIVHSHDPLLDLIINKLGDEGFVIENSCVGSGMALSLLSLGEADIACIHLFDPNTGDYNKPYLEKYFLSTRAVFLGGYYRELVFAFRPGLDPSSYNTVDDVVSEILRGNLKIVNRNKGSGTRVFFDYLLRTVAEKMKLPVDKVKGYENEVYTHIDVAKNVALGRADAALVLRYAAELYGLKYIHVTWERFECITLRENTVKRGVIRFKELINSEWVKNQLRTMPGYKPLHTHPPG